ncbi:hypothetical protein C8R44DRAFT_753944 [Mycena epipterygia]|nr:hypothetical protein C8R44DRAFT_753944 [Mycena epipterygia]
MAYNYYQYPAALPPQNIAVRGMWRRLPGMVMEYKVSAVVEQVSSVYGISGMPKFSSTAAQHYPPAPAKYISSKSDFYTASRWAGLWEAQAAATASRYNYPSWRFCNSTRPFCWLESIGAPWQSRESCVVLNVNITTLAPPVPTINLSR